MQGIYSQKAVMSILDRHSVAPLKKLGQNFLIDENVVEKIAEAAVVCENVIEIGPGMGALTRKLAKKAKKLVAVELDSGMVKVLEERHGKELQERLKQPISLMRISLKCGTDFGTERAKVRR